MPERRGLARKIAFDDPAELSLQLLYTRVQDVRALDL